MEIGTGIAIFSVWLLPVAAAISSDITEKGLNATNKQAFIITLMFLGYDLTKLL